MAGGHWPHTVWKYNVGLGEGLTQPLVPFYDSVGYLAASVSANSATDLTVVRARYDLSLFATIVLDSGGKAQVGPDVWADLVPAYRLRAQPTAFSGFVTPWGAGEGETDGIADGGFEVSLADGPRDNATGNGTLVVQWHASGNTEGMRKLPGDAGVQVIAVMGWAFNSYMAGYAGLMTNVTWRSNAYLKVLYGSSSTIT